MILLPALYLDGPVELFQENDPSHGVRKRDVSEGQAFVSPLEHLRGEAERAAEDEGYVAAAVDAQSGELLGEFFGGDGLSPLPVEGDHVCSGGQALEQAFSLGGQHLFPGVAVHVYFWDLDHFDGEVAPQAFQVVVAARCGPALKPSDRHNSGAPDHSISNSCRPSPA